MNVSMTATRLAAAFALALFAPAAGAQLHFNFEFDGPFSNSGAPPVVGTGSLDLASDPGNGAFSLGSLASPTFSFTVLNATYTNADIISNTGFLTIIISPYANGERRLQFNSGGNDAGALVLARSSGQLTLEPDYLGQTTNKYLVTDAASGSIIKGAYLGLAPAATPEPGGIALLFGTASVGAVLLRKRRR